MPSNVFSTLEELAKAVESLRGQLEPLRRLVPAGAAPARANARRAPARKGRARRASRKAAPKASRGASPKVKALRKLQGRYMGLVRNLSSAQKAQVKKVKMEKGYGPALKLAVSLGK